MQKGKPDLDKIFNPKSVAIIGASNTKFEGGVRDAVVKIVATELEDTIVSWSGIQSIKSIS